MMALTPCSIQFYTSLRVGLLLTMTRALRILSVILTVVVALSAMYLLAILSPIVLLGYGVTGQPDHWSAKVVYTMFAPIVYLFFCLLSCIPLGSSRLLIMGGLLLHAFILPLVIELSLAAVTNESWFMSLEIVGVVVAYPILWWSMCLARVELKRRSTQ
jgi:hypothetical protein